jgi:type I restriction enzyme S subunit
MHDEHGTHLRELRRTTAQIAGAYRRSAVRAGDLVVSIGPSFGKVMEVPAELEGANLTQGTARVALRDGVNRRFIFWVLRSRRSLEFWEAGCAGATFSALTLERLSETPVPLPDEARQRALAAFLDRKTAAIDQLIQKKERLIELLEEKRQALITQAVTKGLDPSVPMKGSGVEWIGRFPAHWRLRRLKQVATRVVVGIAQAATHAYADSGIPLVRSTNLRPDRLLLDDLLYIDKSFADQLRSKYIHPGDLLTVRTGNAGVTAVVPPDLPLSQCFTMLITTLQQGHSSHFFGLQLNSDVGVTYFRRESWGTAQENISVPILQNTPVLVPPASEQRDIVTMLKKRTGQLGVALAVVERQTQVLHEYRQALISAAVTGQIDVSNGAA